MDAASFLWTAAGVVISVLLPVLAKSVHRTFKPTAAPLTSTVKAYGMLLLFSLIVALVIQAWYQYQHPGNTPMAWYAALLLGYTAEATLEKITL